MSGAFRSAGVGVVGRSDVRRGSLRARYSPLGRAASMSLLSGRGGRVHFMQVPLGEFLPFGLMPRGERPNLSLLLLDQIGAGFLAGGHMRITAALSRMLRVKRVAFSAMPLCELDDLVAMRQAQLGHPIARSPATVGRLIGTVLLRTAMRVDLIAVALGGALFWRIAGGAFLPGFLVRLRRLGTRVVVDAAARRGGHGWCPCSVAAGCARRIVNSSRRTRSTTHDRERSCCAASRSSSVQMSSLMMKDMGFFIPPIRQNM
jgi:hypothetical protein